MLNLKHLYYFYVYSQQLSTSRASKKLGITSPALSNQLKELEEFLGAKLTQRTDGKVKITELGEMVVHYADRMFSAYEELKVRLPQAEDFKGTLFRVGICQYLGARFSFDMLSLIVSPHFSFSEKTQICFDSSDKILAGFNEDKFDVIIGGFAEEHTEEDNWLSQIVHFPVRLFASRSLMGSIKDKQFGQVDLSQVIELANTKKIPLALPMQSSTLRSETERFLLNSKIFPKKTIECNNSSAIVQLIERGLAIGFFPTPCLLDFNSSKQLAIIGPPGGYWIHCVSILIKKGGERSMSKISPLAPLFSPDAKFK
jgi:LysR family transcriptional activator of nhaA